MLVHLVGCLIFVYPTLAGGVLKISYGHWYIANIITAELGSGPDQLDIAAIATMKRACSDILKTAAALPGRTF